MGGRGRTLYGHHNTDQRARSGHLGLRCRGPHVRALRRFGARGSPFASYEEIVANQRGERPAYGTAIDFQPPFTLRLGLEIGLR